MNKQRRKTILTTIAALAVVGIAASTGLVLARVQNPTIAVAAPVAWVLPVETTQIRPQTGFAMRRAFSGRVQPRRDSVLGFEMAGRLDRVLVEEGQTVDAGSELAILDTARLDARRIELEAELAEAEARLALARTTLHRNRGIVGKGGVSRQALDEAEEARRAAGAGVDLAHQRIRSLEVELAKSRLRAPFSGTIVARTADEGRVLGTGEPVLRIQENVLPEVRIGVGGRATEQLVPGRIYRLSWQGVEIAARLRAVLPLRAAVVRTVDALFDLLDDDVAIRPGDSVTLHLKQQVEQAGSWLPANALTEGERGLWSLYVAQPAEGPSDPPGATHRLVRRTVELLHQEADRVYVRGAIGRHERIVSSGPHRVVPGQWVRTGASLIAQTEQHHD